MQIPVRPYVQESVNEDNRSGKRTKDSFDSRFARMKQFRLHCNNPIYNKDDGIRGRHKKLGEHENFSVDRNNNL